MRTKRFICFACVLAVCLSAFGVTACSGKKKGPGLHVWSTYNTEKVLKTGGEYEDLGIKIDVSMAKGETEGAQLIVTPDRDVNSLSLKTSDLTQSDGTVFSKENIDVYLQKYIKIEQKTYKQENFDYPLGAFVPDMLLPLDIAEKYGENTAESRCNQGITVEFKTTSETKAGVYTGTFAVVADGKEVSVPVSLTVWDIDITRVNGRSCVCWFSESWMSGEYEVSDELYKNYYEASMNDYKFMLMYLPNYDDPVKMAQSAVEYFDNPNFTAFSIPANSYSYEDKRLIKGAFYDYVMELAKASTPEKLLFEKAYVYVMFLDEVRAAYYDNVRTTHADIYEIEDKVLEDLENLGYFDDYDADYKIRFTDAIQKLSIVITVDSDQVDYLGNDVNTYCGSVNLFNDPVERNVFATAANVNADRGGSTWFYTCMQPMYPYPSHHLDDGLLGSRVMRWMQKDYGFDGYLHWSFFYYNSMPSAEHLQIDPYETAMRFAQVNGDGFMVYPGKKYGLNTYLPSVRLTAFRDGQEDYDLLCAFDETVREKEKYYGLAEGTVSTRSQIADFYSDLYNGVIYKDDSAAFYAIRNQVAEIIMSQETQTNYLVSTAVTENSATANIYLNKGYTVKINGEEISPVESGSGNKYTVSSDRTANVILDVEVYSDGTLVESHRVFVASKSVKVALADGMLSVSRDSEISYTADGAEIVLKAKGDTKNELLSFTPSVAFTPSMFESGLNKIDSLKFEIKNTSDRKLNFGVRLKTAVGYYVLASTNVYTVEPDATVKIEFSNLYEYESAFSQLSSATLELIFDNTDASEALMPDRTFVISNIFYDFKSEEKA